MSSPGDLPSREQLGLPEVLIEIISNPRGGLVLVSGGPSSGVSTTLNWMVDFLNMSWRAHLMIFEERIEISHYHKASLVSQREKGGDYQDLALALRETHRQGAAVVMVGAPMDPESLTAAAELGYNRRTVLAGMPGQSAGGLLESIHYTLGPARWDGFVTGLSAVIHQRLLTGRYGERVPVLEILRNMSGVSSMLHERKFHQLSQAMESSTRQGMQTLEQGLFRGVQDGLFGAEEAMRQANDPGRLGFHLDRLRPPHR